MLPTVVIPMGFTKKNQNKIYSLNLLPLTVEKESFTENIINNYNNYHSNIVINSNNINSNAVINNNIINNNINNNTTNKHLQIESNLKKYQNSPKVFL